MEDLTLYIANGHTLNLAHIKCPIFKTKFQVTFVSNAPPIPVLGGVGLNIDRCKNIQTFEIEK